MQIKLALHQYTRIIIGTAAERQNAVKSRAGISWAISTRLSAV